MSTENQPESPPAKLEFTFCARCGVEMNPKHDASAPMQTRFSKLAEEQTLRIERINDRVAVRVRQCADGVVTRDVMVDGFTYTPHVSENWIATNLAHIIEIVAGKLREAHMGMGQWVNESNFLRG